MGQKRILIVEDEMLSALLLKNHLQKAGYQITSIVTRGEDAITSTEKDEPDLILMDIFLDDDVDGIEAARRIQKIKEIPVIYMSATDDERTIQRAAETLYSTFISKPYSIEQVIHAVHGCLQ